MVRLESQWGNCCGTQQSGRAMAKEGRIVVVKSRNSTQETNEEGVMMEKKLDASRLDEVGVCVARSPRSLRG